MKPVSSFIAISLVAALAAPLSASAEGTWVRSNDEAGWQYVAAPFGSVKHTPALPAAKPLQLGDVSADRDWVYTGGESGWAPRQVTYRYESGRFVRVEDPTGHMQRLADKTPIAAQQPIALESGG